MIPVRFDRLPQTLRTFADPGPDMAGRICPGCDQPMLSGPVTLVPIGPGDDPEAQAKARGGRWHTASAVLVHSSCAGLTDDQVREAL